MPQPPAKQFSGIFVSYRRDDSSGHAGRLSDRLVEHFGKDRIFMDIDTIEPGEDFVTVIENAVGSCEILIAIIGRNWLSGTGGSTGRLDNPNDFVRLEIATALSRDIRVIPVLVQRASMPKPQDLPDDLAKFTRRNAVELSDLRWQSDVDQLISVMERVLVKREEAVRLAEAARQSEEELQRQEEEEKRRAEEVEREHTEAAESARREAEQEAEHRRREEEKQARAEEERHASEARFRDSNLAARQKQLDKPSTEITAGDVSTPAYRNRRVVLIAVASLIVLVVAAALIWLKQRDSNSSGNTNRAAAAAPSTATQPSPATQPSSTTQSPAKPRPAAGTVVQNQMGIELVYVPAGSFMMGANNLESAEQPVHQVTLSEGFYMGKYEVTQAEWKSVMGTNPSAFKGNNLPVEQVYWDEVKEFVRKLNEMNDGYTYRLPTEAEWEYACRAGTKGYYAGDIDAMAWYDKNSGSQTHPVGSKQPNAFGLYDMHGNVYEWCQDWDHVTYDGAPVDGRAWENGGLQRLRIIRGGSWRHPAFVYASSASRSNAKPDLIRDFIGFRLVAVARSQ